MTEEERLTWLADTAETLRTYIDSGHAKDEQLLKWMLNEWQNELDELRAEWNQKNEKRVG